KPFEANRCYSKFTAYTLLNHAGDFKAAARELGEQGYGTGKKPKGKAKGNVPPGNVGTNGGTPPGTPPPSCPAFEIAARPIDWLRGLGVPLKGVRKYGRVQGNYFLVLDNGDEVEVGNSEDLLTPRTVQSALTDGCGVVIPELKRADWRPVAQAL